MVHIKENNNYNQASISIAIIVSQFNNAITTALKDGVIQRLLERGCMAHNLTIIDVPGAIEIPIIAQRLARKKHFTAIIALGAVIRGETTHYDYVCEQVSNGCQRVSLDFEIPVIFGVLTTENEEQAWDRLGGKHGHKGTDSADCALAMHSILQQC